VTAAGNQPPVANSQSVTTPQDTAKMITLTGSDPDGTFLIFILASNPSHGTLSGYGAYWTYTPAAGYSGADSFTFYVNDGYVNSFNASVSITVTGAVNQAPTANTQSVTTQQGAAKAIGLSGSDPEGSPL